MKKYYKTRSHSVIISEFFPHLKIFSSNYVQYKSLVVVKTLIWRKFCKKWWGKNYWITTLWITLKKFREINSFVNSLSSRHWFDGKNDDFPEKTMIDFSILQCIVSATPSYRCVLYHLTEKNLGLLSISARNYGIFLSPKKYFVKSTL